MENSKKIHLNKNHVTQCNGLFNYAEIDFIFLLKRIDRVDLCIKYKYYMYIKHMIL